MRFEGVYTALVTPFSRDDGSVDSAMLKILIERQITAGTQGIIIAGSTGEGQTLTRDEWQSAVEIALGYKGSIHILASCGSSSTAETVSRVQDAANLGVHGALVSTPAYNKPPQRGLIKHFEAIAKATPLPVVVYNIPGRTAVNISPETLAEIWKIPSMVSIKESSGNMDQALQILQALPAKKTFLSGDDSNSLPLWSCGAHGVVSVLSNISPKGLQSLWQTWKARKVDEATKLHNVLLEITKLLFVESNPIPAKWCVGQLLQSPSFGVRLPLVDLDPTYYPALKRVLQGLKDKDL